MWENSLLILIVMSGIYGVAALSGCLHILKWRGLRMGILGGLLLLAAAWAGSLQLASAVSLPSLCILLLWTLPYMGCRGQAQSREDRELSRIKGEFLTGSAGSAFFLLLAHSPWGGTGLVAGLEAILLVWPLGAAFVYGIYFLTYRNLFQAEDMLPVLLTNRKEIKAFLDGQIKKSLLFSAVAGFLVLVLASIALVWAGMGEAGGKWTAPGLIVTLISVAIMVKYAMNCFPLREIRLARKSIREMKRAGDIHADNLARRFKVNLAGHPEGNVFLIIGESANRDHMKAFNPAYAEETTPWQSVMRNKPEFFFFPKTYACFTQTAQTISRMITGMNQYNHQSPDYLVTLIDAAKAAGYTTWWCTNHKANDYQTGYIMQTADHVVEVLAPTGDDAQLLDVMDTIPQEGHHFVVLHIMGSHLRYGDRYPTGFPVIPGNNKKISEYDTSIAYTDHILQKMTEKARETLHASVIMYVSDHSEDMKYTHGTGHFTFDMTRIPLWIYLSPSYQQKHKEKAEFLRRHESCVFTNDLVFDTLCGLIGADNYGRTEAYDLSSPSYALTEKEALTMHGKMHIAEDMQ